MCFYTCAGQSYLPTEQHQQITLKHHCKIMRVSTRTGRHISSFSKKKKRGRGSLSDFVLQLANFFLFIFIFIFISCSCFLSFFLSFFLWTIRICVRRREWFWDVAIWAVARRC